jgi:hypothetical protein
LSIKNCEEKKPHKKMSSSMGHGFREVLIDQAFAGKWMEVDMNLGKNQLK